MDSIIITNFQSTMDAEYPFTISPGLFHEGKRFVVIDIPFCENNGNKCKDFIKKFLHLINGKYHIPINWITKNVKTLFQLKDKKIYPAARSIMDYSLVRRTILVNQNVI